MNGHEMAAHEELKAHVFHVKNICFHFASVLIVSFVFFDNLTYFFVNMNVEIFNCYNQYLEQMTFSISIANYKQILREQLTVEIKKKKVILSECNNKKGWKLVIQYEDKTRLKPDTLSQLKISKSNDGKDILLMNFSIGARLGLK